MTLELPTGHEVEDVAFHFIARKIIVFSRLKHFPYLDDVSFFLHCFSETGKLENSMCLCKKERYCVLAMTSHPSGPVAVVERESITYI